MRVFTTSGFVSAVFKGGAIQVRARDGKSLEPLAKPLNQVWSVMHEVEDAKSWVR